MLSETLSNDLREELRSAWGRYLKEIDPFRPQLHAYCRRLAGNVWDAEDLMQDTMTKGFAALSSLHREVQAPRAYLLRIATNLWTDRLRKAQVERAALTNLSQEAARPDATPGATEDAAILILQNLRPQERAALILKEAFGMNISEIAEALATSVGATKSALFRGRSRIKSPGEDASPRPLPSAELVSNFVALFNAGDREGLLELVLDNADIEHVGVFHQHGEAAKKSGTSWISGALGEIPDAPDAGFESQRTELATFHDEPLVLLFRLRGGRETLEEIIRFEEADEKICRLRSYGSCPETMGEVSRELEISSD